MTAIVWFTRDLRVHDQPALSAAVAEHDRVLPLFVLDDHILASSFHRPNRARFLLSSLHDLDESLRARGGRLVVRRGDPVAEIVRVAQTVDASHVYASSDVSGYAQRRERRLRHALAEQRRELSLHPGVTVVEPGTCAPAGGDHARVFTPYYRKWIAQPRRAILAAPRRLTLPAAVRVGRLPGLASLCPGRAAPNLLPGGETAGRRRLSRWLRHGMRDYAERHDDLAGDATSRLSPYLHFGALSPAEVARRADDQGGAGAQAFVRQLGWRDFHHQLLAARPDAAHASYRDRGDRWRDDPQATAAWQAGETGFPIVDAGIRQLIDEGWMHNRARLITASFFTKHLYLDWRLGAAFFLDHLVDGDVANNQLNWQWVAGTGTDTRPNRVLNPLRQADRYDPDGDYVRRYLPQLRGIAGRAVHRPWLLPDSQRRALRYPAPLVDLADAAGRFRAARGR